MHRQAQAPHQSIKSGRTWASILQAASCANAGPEIDASKLSGERSGTILSPKDCREELGRDSCTSLGVLLDIFLDRSHQTKGTRKVAGPEDDDEAEPARPRGARRRNALHANLGGTVVRSEGCIRAGRDGRRAVGLIHSPLSRLEKLSNYSGPG